MDRTTLSLGVFGAIGLANLAVGWWVIAKRGTPLETRRWLATYAMAGGLLAGVQALLGIGGRPPSDLVSHLPLYFAVLIGLGLDHAARYLPRNSTAQTRHFWPILIWVAALVILDLGVFIPGRELISGRGWLIDRADFIRAGLALAWAVPVIHAIRATLRAYRRAAQPLHRNRLAYWATALALAVLGGALGWIGLAWASALGLTSGLILAAIALVNHRLPDARRAVYQGGATVLTLALTIAIYAAVLAALPSAAAAFPGLPFPVVAVAGAVVLAGLAPGLAWMSRQVRRWRGDRSYQPRKIVGEYSLNISNILDLDRLAAVALGLISDVFGAEQAALYVVDGGSPASGRDEPVHLFCAGSLSADAPTGGSLPADSPFLDYLTSEFGPITQYDLDVDARFQTLSRAERFWLAKLNMDVYVPIYANQEWIGLFALGAKHSRHQYYSEDLELLSTLADQTAVALQNARLVTDLKRLNSDLRTAYSALNEANQRLDQLDRTKSDFINVISHELRTPLAILFGYAQILLEELGQQGQAENLQLVEGMTTGVTRLNEVIENMLDMAKIDSRSLQLQAQPVHVEHLVQKATWQLRWALNERNLALEAHGLADVPTVEGDAEALYKALHHLVANAVKFTPDGGQITITARHEPDGPTGGSVQVIVSDTGIGIDPRFLELIFDKFYQAGDSRQHSSGKTKFKGGGPGLGLAIARGIAQAHGGNLWAESAGHDEQLLPGSRFVLALPVKQTPSVAAPPESEPVA